MYKRAFFDTNVLIDAAVATRPQHDEACEALMLCNGGGDMGIACGLSLKDAYYILTRLYNEEYARASVRWLMGLLVIGPIGAEECDLAVNSNEPDFEDGLVRACAELNDADFIITRDKAAFALSPIKSVTPGEYLQIHANEERAFMEDLGVH